MNKISADLLVSVLVNLEDVCRAELDVDEAPDKHVDLRRQEEHEQRLLDARDPVHAGEGLEEGGGRFNRKLSASVLA